MIRFLIPLILLVIVLVLARRYLANAATPEQKKSRKITLGLIVFAVVMLVLAIFHRMHWVAALLAGLVPLGRVLGNYLLDYYRQSRSSAGAAPEPNPSASLTETEALQVLGLQKPFTPEEVVEAHRKLIQKFHPDRGGNNYLATRINAAKELLLK